MHAPRLAIVAALVLLAGGCADEEPAPGAASTTEPSDPGDTSSDGSTPDGTLPDVTSPVGAELRLTALATLGEMTDVAVHPGTGDLYIAEKPGTVQRVDRATGEVLGEVVDISDRVTLSYEQGLLGIAIDPDAEHLYLSSSGPDGETRIDELPFDADGGVDVDDQRIVLEVPQPHENHNGGDIAFGPDGYLYVALGDGGGGGDPDGTGQDPTDLLASILRIDPSRPGRGDRGYAIPDDNPFADGADGAPEVWLYGARNPWRISWDGANGDLWVGDVGQGDWEEIDHLPAPDAGRGANLGWSAVEGDVAFEERTAPPGAVEPVHVYGHGEGECSVIGGVVYRGDEIDALVGTYLFADHCIGRLQGLRLDASGGEPAVLDLGLDVGGAQLSGFGEGPDGEIYVLTLGGTLYRLDAG